MDVRPLHQFKSEDQFISLMEQLPLLVKASNADGKFIFFNAAWKDTTGIKGVELSDETWADAVHPDDLDQYRATLSSKLLERSEFKSKYRMKLADGKFRWLAEHTVPSFSADGSFEGFVCYAQDIDDLLENGEPRTDYDDGSLQREQVVNEELEAANEELNSMNEELQYSQDRLSQANSNLEQILDMLPASVVVIRGDDLVVEMINNSNLQYWKKKREEVVGRPFLDILPDLADQPFAGQLREVMRTGEIIDVKESPVLFTSPDGSIRETFVDYTYQPLYDLEGNRTGVLVMSFEITDRVISRRLLEKYAEELSLANTQLLASNEELAISESRFKYLIQEAPVAIGVLHGRDLVLESANVKILEVWGKTEKVIGMPLHKALPELEGQPFLDILDGVFISGQAFHANEIMAVLEHNGALKELFFNVTYQPIFGASGTTSDILIVAVDVTQQVTSRKQVEQSEQHFRYLADLVPAKISNALPTGEVLFVNKQWLDFAGMSFEDLRDFGYHQMMHPDEISAFQAGLEQAAETGTPFVSEMRFQDVNGEYVWHLNVASPIMDDNGRVKMWVGSTTDIQMLKDEEQRKNDFIGMVAHELKTPITSLTAYLQLLQRKATKNGDSMSEHVFDQSLKQVRQMTTMINGFLNVSRLESGKIHIEKTEFDMAELIRDLEQEHEMLYSSHQLKFVNLESVNVFADKAKIGQVINNLVSNAVKYSPQATMVEISCTTVANQVRVSIRDEGIGIKPEDVTRLFERYYRVGENRNISGFGIGLYLSAEIVERHEGKIWVDSEPGEGSVFHFELPLS